MSKGLQPGQLASAVLSPLASAVASLDRVVLPYLTAVNGSPSAGQFRSSITGRAPLVDPANDLSVHGQVDRIIVQSIFQIQNEFGPNGEPVWGAVNDQFGYVRFVGAGWQNQNNAYGIHPQTTTANDYVEVSFYGTGLNVLSYVDNNSPVRDVRSMIDGGAESASSVYPPIASPVIAGRNYSVYQIINIASGLSLGLHTVKLRINAGQAGGFIIEGFEFLNEASTLNVNAGSYLTAGALLQNTALDLMPIKPAGYAGTAGAKVVTYLNPDGTIGQAYTSVGTPAYLGSTTHTNEDIIRNFSWREFGCGRSDDFSTLSSTTGSARAFTLDDNVHTLVGNSSCLGGLSEGLNIGDTTNSYHTFTFVGTGLDILVATPGATSDPFTVYIDGTSRGNIATTLGGAGVKVWVKIASGLFFGTHIVKILRTTAVTGQLNLFALITYGSKTPSVPAGSKALGEHFVMADYVANATVGTETIGTGVIRKQGTREMVFVGAGWNISSTTMTSLSGFATYMAASGNYVQFSFYGTGFELRGYCYNGASNSNTVLMDGLTPSGVTTSTYGGWSYSAGTLNQNNASANSGAGFSLSGLAYGFHTVKITSNTAQNFYADCIDVISPIYSPRYIGPVALQATSMIGNSSVADRRELGITQQKMCKAVGVTGGPTTSSTTNVPLPDCATSYYQVQDGLVDISFIGQARSSAVGPGLNLAIYVDGTAVPESTIYPSSDYASNDHMQATIASIFLKQGWHFIQAFWSTNSGTMTNTGRQLVVRSKQ